MKAAAGLLHQVENESRDAFSGGDGVPLFEVVPAEAEADYRDIHIERGPDAYVLSGKQLRKLFDSTNFNDYGSLRYLYKHLLKRGVIQELKSLGLQEGDTIRMFAFEFEYEDEGEDGGMGGLGR